MRGTASSEYWGLASEAAPLVHLRWRAKIYSGATPPRNNPEFWESGSHPWLGSGAVNQGLVVEPTALITDEALKACSTKRMPKGSLIIALAGQGKTKGTVAQLGIECYGNQSLACIAPENDNPRFLYWWLTSVYRQIRGLSSDDSRDGLNQEMVGSIPIPIVPLSLQSTIAEYLDSEVAKIDALIAAKNEMFDLLGEKHLALTNSLAVKGLNSRVCFTPSGLDWLHEVPEHWEIRRAKLLFQEIDERSATGEETLLSLRMVKGLVPHNDVSEKLIPAESLIDYKIARPGEIVINRMRAASGLVAVTPEHGIVSPDYAVFRAFNGVDPEYFTLLFKSPLMQAVFRSLSKGLGTGQSGFLRLYSEDFLAIKLPVPPLAEQKAIVAELARERARTATAEAALESSVKLLKERRAALITAAVTGQLAPEEMSA